MAKKSGLTIGPNDDKAGWTFNSLREAQNLPVPVDGRQALDFPHQYVEEFFVRVHPATKAGTVRRSWVHRYKEEVLDERTGKLVKEDRKPAFAELDVLTYDEAKEKVEDARTARLRAKAMGDGPTSRAPRLTMGAAWQLYALETQQQRDRTVDTSAGHYDRYMKHLADKWLDELNYEFWLRFVKALGEGSLLVGQRTDPHGKQVPDRRGPLSAATLQGVMTTASNIFTLAHKHKGLRDVEKGWNPASEAREHVGTPNKRTGHIKLNDIAAVWCAADVWCTSWARDMLRLYMLTGLRRSLLIEMQFTEIDWATRSIIISPHKRGTKRAKRKTSVDAPNLRLPLSDTAFEILRARWEWAKDKTGPVWYAVRPTRGKASRGADELAPPNTDPRNSWEYLEELVLGGQHFGPHDLRRTYATIGGNAGADVVALSLLMLHSGQTVAAAAGVGGITLDYIQTDEAQDRMRAAANVVEQYILRRVEMLGTASAIDEKPLPAALEDAVADDDL